MTKKLLKLAIMATVLGTGGMALGRSQPALSGQASQGFEACFNRDWDGSHIRNSNSSAACSNARYVMGWVVDQPGGYHVRVSGTDASVKCDTIASSIGGDFRDSTGLTPANVTATIDVPDWGYAYTVCTVPFGKQLFKLDYWQ
jgi:hypothetical protein